MNDDITTRPEGSYEVPPARPRHRVRTAVLTGVAGALVLGGGGAIAYASGDGGASTPAASPSGSTASDAPAGPAGPAAPGSGSGSDGSAPATPPTPQPHIDGTVTAVDGDTVTVTDPEGFSRTIKTSSDTEYGDGVSSPLATGTKIHASGTVDSDKTSLDATKIETMPEPGQGPAGGPKPPTGSDAPKPPTGSDAPQPPSGSDAPQPPTGSDAPQPPSGAPSDAPSDQPTGS